MNKSLKRILKLLKHFNKEGLLEEIEIETTADYTIIEPGVKNYHGTWYTIKFYKRAKHDFLKD